jgi:hypothetical protein
MMMAWLRSQGFHEKAHKRRFDPGLGWVRHLQVVGYRGAMPHETARQIAEIFLLGGGIGARKPLGGGAIKASVPVGLVSRRPSS